MDPTALRLFGKDIEFRSGKHLVRSRAAGGRPYPAARWTPLLANWVEMPDGVEEPQNLPYYVSAYPNWWIDGADNPLQSGRVLEGGAWPQKTLGIVTGNMVPPAVFGNAVDNAVDLLKHLDEAPPDWNLDADRGLAFFTWQMKGAYGNLLQIEPET